MIRNLFFFIALLMLPVTAFAASFTASVDENHVVAGEGFALQLTLSGAEPKGNPDTNVLTPAFSIASQGRTSETTIINGKFDSSIGWQLTLIPNKIGQMVIPSMTIETDNGNLSTQPITLEVGGAATQQSSQANRNPEDSRNVTVTAAVSSSDPYQNQPIIYTVRIVAHAGVSDMSPGNVVADGAIVEPLGKPKIQNQNENGVPVKVIELRYTVTPLQAKTITIEPTIVQGNEQAKLPGGRLGRMGNGFPDPLEMLQEMDNFPGFMGIKPFSVASNAVVLDVKPPAVAMDPWLPLQNLQIQEKMDLSQPIKVGDPINRTLTLLATGAAGSQLPALASQQNTAEFKVYADKPIISDSVDSAAGTIQGSREENDSLIPEAAGEFKLPAIRIPWWDIKNNRIAYAELPEHTVNVLPASRALSSAPIPQNPSQALADAGPLASAAPPRPVSSATSLSWVMLTAFLLIIIVAMAGLALHQNRKLKRLSMPTVEMPELRSAKSHQAVADIEWDQIKTPDDLHRELLAYAHKRWGAPRNGALETVFESQRQKLLDPQDAADAEMIVRSLTAALYARTDFDLGNLKLKCRRIIAVLNRSVKDHAPANEKLPELNPS